MKFRAMLLGLAVTILPAISMSATDTNATAKQNVATPEQIEKDGQILSVVETVDNNEIAAAKAVMDKKVSKSVHDYAKLMIDQHQANLKDAEKLSKKTGINPVESDASTDLVN
ncbi:MAG TPA: DUF4142 domain-containing protein, partial [Gammaproteobacteria bacterium]|nr:DUF4142 domain-containing protein [Gammaproteobacteria bacterium]